MSIRCHIAPNIFITRTIVQVPTNNLGIIGAVKEPVYSSKLTGKRTLIALAIYSSFIERQKDGGQLFKEELVV